jgi:hypothetical protein
MKQKIYFNLMALLTILVVGSASGMEQPFNKSNIELTIKLFPNSSNISENNFHCRIFAKSTNPIGSVKQRWEIDGSPGREKNVLEYLIGLKIEPKEEPSNPTEEVTAFLSVLSDDNTKYTESSVKLDLHTLEYIHTLVKEIQKDNAPDDNDRIRNPNILLEPNSIWIQFYNTLANLINVNFKNTNPQVTVNTLPEKATSASAPSPATKAISQTIAKPVTVTPPVTTSTKVTLPQSTSTTVPVITESAPILSAETAESTAVPENGIPEQEFNNMLKTIRAYEANKLEHIDTTEALNYIRFLNHINEQGNKRQKSLVQESWSEEPSEQKVFEEKPDITQGIAEKEISSPVLSVTQQPALALTTKPAESTTTPVSKEEISQTTTPVITKKRMPGSNKGTTRQVSSRKKQFLPAAQKSEQASEPINAPIKKAEETLPPTIIPVTPESVSLPPQETIEKKTSKTAKRKRQLKKTPAMIEKQDTELISQPAQVSTDISTPAQSVPIAENKEIETQISTESPERERPPTIVPVIQESAPKSAAKKVESSTIPESTSAFSTGKTQKALGDSKIEFHLTPHTSWWNPFSTTNNVDDPNKIARLSIMCTSSSSLGSIKKSKTTSSIPFSSYTILLSKADNNNKIVNLNIKDPESFLIMFTSDIEYAQLEHIITYLKTIQASSSKKDFDSADILAEADPTWLKLYNFIAELINKNFTKDPQITIDTLSEKTTQTLTSKQLEKYIKGAGNIAALTTDLKSKRGSNSASKPGSKSVSALASLKLAAASITEKLTGKSHPDEEADVKLQTQLATLNTTATVTIGGQEYKLSKDFNDIEAAGYGTDKIGDGQHFEIYLMPDGLHLIPLFKAVESLLVGNFDLTNAMAFVALRPTNLIYDSEGLMSRFSRQVLPRIVIGFKSLPGTATNDEKIARRNEVEEFVNKISKLIISELTFSSMKPFGYHPRNSEKLTDYIYYGFGSPDFKIKNTKGFERHTTWGGIRSADNDMALPEGFDWNYILKVR